MSDADERKTSGRKPLSLGGSRGGSGSGTVQQSFARGRSKQVVVEKKRKRTGAPAGKDAPAASKDAPQSAKDKARAALAAKAKQLGLSEEELLRRQAAIQRARGEQKKKAEKEEAEARARQEQERLEAQRRAEEEQRKAAEEEAERKKAEEEARKQAEEALHENRALLQGVLDHAPAFIFAKDLQGRITLANRQLEHLFEVGRGEMLGKPNTGEHLARIDAERFLRGTPGIKPGHQRDKALDDMGIAVATDHKAPAFILQNEPDLADASLDLVGVAILGRLERVEALAELDEIAVALFPIVEEVELVNEGVDIV